MRTLVKTVLQNLLLVGQTENYKEITENVRHGMIICLHRTLRHMIICDFELLTHFCLKGPKTCSN